MANDFEPKETFLDKEPEEQQLKFSEEDEKLTDWQNEPTLQMLKEDLEQAKPSHITQVSKIKHWNDLMYITGDVAPVKRKTRSSVQIAFMS